MYDFFNTLYEQVNARRRERQLYTARPLER